MATPRESTGASEQKSKARLERLLLNIEEAWNRGDAQAYAGFFTEDGVYVARGGVLWEGREEIQRQQAAAFAGPLRYTILHVRAWRVQFITSKVAMIYAAMEIVHPWNGGMNGQVLASLVCAAMFEDWRIASQHNTDMISK
jgi:uncharacterized protein (TIGR02246 family)